MKTNLSILIAIGLILTLSTGGPALASDLIKGADMTGWVGNTGTWTNVGGVHARIDDNAHFSPEVGSGVLYNGLEGRTHNLISEREHGDCFLEIEFNVPKGSNSGVYLQGRYEIQVFDSYGVPDKRVQHSDCGGIYQRYAESEGRGYEGHAPATNASKESGKWQKFKIWFKAPRFDDDGNKISNAKFIKVEHNGKVIHENVELTGPTRAATWLDDEKVVAPLMIQGDHGPIAYRNIRIKDKNYANK